MFKITITQLNSKGKEQIIDVKKKSTHKIERGNMIRRGGFRESGVKTFNFEFIDK